MYMRMRSTPDTSRVSLLPIQFHGNTEITVLMEGLQIVSSRPPIPPYAEDDRMSDLSGKTGSFNLRQALTIHPPIIHSEGRKQEAKNNEYMLHGERAYPILMIPTITKMQ